MRKKLRILFAALAMCLLLVTPAYAAGGKPNVELMNVGCIGNDGYYSPQIFFRNNSGKTIKYLDWYFTLYNRVNDPTPDEVTHNSTVHLQVVGPIEPDKPIVTSTTRHEEDTGKFILYNDAVHEVYIDKYGNYYIYTSQHYSNTSWVNDSGTELYLTNEEATSNTFYQRMYYKNAWYSKIFSYTRLQKVIVTYMDGTTEVIDGPVAEVPWLNSTLSNNMFKDDLKQYSAVYNYKDYQKYNPDLVSVFGNDKYGSFHHFITSGMNEGRQGSKEFNLSAYKANNPDLVAAFGDDNVKYYQHYMTTGKAEGRKAT